MKLVTMLVLAATLAAAPSARAQQGGDPIAENLFAPELVMQHQQELGITDEQRTAIIADIGRAQPKAMEMQWKLQREVQSLAALLKSEAIDEEKMLAQLDRVLAGEREIKRVQLALLVRIKNKLTPEQRIKLQGLRGSSARE
jgi:Spy/CpxP family protein refolding chaperone